MADTKPDVRYRRPVPAALQTLQDWLEQNDARLLWAAYDSPAGGKSPAGRLEAYSIKGVAFLVHRRVDNGWDVYTAATRSLDVNATLYAASKAIGEDCLPPEVTSAMARDEAAARRAEGERKIS